MQRGYQGAGKLYSTCEDLLSPTINYTPSNSEVLITEAHFQKRYKVKDSAATMQGTNVVVVEITCR